MNDILNISGQNMALLIVVVFGIVLLVIGLVNIYQWVNRVDTETYKDMDDG